MGFGRNPHVAKAEAAEVKAQEATDVASEVRAYLEAAHLWDRAAAKELELTAGRRGAGGAAERLAKYEANAAAARERSSAATQKQAPSPATLAAKLKVLDGGTGDDPGKLS
jgi:hypothetical protein